MSEAAAQEMRIDPARANALVENIGHVVQRIDSARGSRKVRLIAVSKLKPATDILALHQSSVKQEHFGENYSDELTEKAGILPRSVKWHMIGGLQTNKCKKLASQVPNLYCVSSVDTSKKADELEKGRKSLAEQAKENLSEKLRVLVQVNTSGEESKSGVEPSEAPTLCRHVREKCPSLQLAGLMTIGAIARSREASGPDALNEDFVALRETRDKVAKELGMEQSELELSMGMSQDFEAAISAGSDEVRVGTTIFGERPAKKDAKIL
ncbi:Pyridoxal phosphate homeostasis protein [Pseudocercospora fuligena]|uniref:Pyridoxal phosphate homeostasis protein n=1 Tax=Pseudocercospora fuligena TaxID=685502 RepID=A0A8H6RIX3_9PEZI|nr:Pyridoxal phosphate homeostasis protein [Pseudocercospora fuligena]